MFHVPPSESPGKTVSCGPDSIPAVLSQSQEGRHFTSNTRNCQLQPIQFGSTFTSFITTTYCTVCTPRRRHTLGSWTTFASNHRATTRFSLFPEWLPQRNHNLNGLPTNPLSVLPPPATSPERTVTMIVFMVTASSANSPKVSFPLFSPVL